MLSLPDKNIFWFAGRSFILDIKFLQISDWRIGKKIRFLTLKYFLLVFHTFKKFSLGEDFCSFDGRNIYYDSRLGLAGFQSMLTRHQNLMKLAGIKDIRTVVDVGANVGFFSTLCRDRFPEAKIFAFEPVPMTCRCLEKNFEGDNNIKFFQAAIGDENTQLRMNFDVQNCLISYMADEGNVLVDVKRLDDALAAEHLGQIDMLKVDTESFEAHVLRGAPKTLAKTKYLFLEISMEEKNEHYTISSLLKLLSTQDYDFQLIGFRNYHDVSEGLMPIMDGLFINKKIKA